MTDTAELIEDVKSKNSAGLGTGALVFVGGMAMAAASFLVENYITKTFRKS